jgi:hypothetical protein
MYYFKTFILFFALAAASLQTYASQINKDDVVLWNKQYAQHLRSLDRDRKLQEKSNLVAYGLSLATFLSENPYRKVTSSYFPKLASFTASAVPVLAVYATCRAGAKGFEWYRNYPEGASLTNREFLKRMDQEHEWVLDIRQYAQKYPNFLNFFEFRNDFLIRLKQDEDGDKICNACAGVAGVGTGLATLSCIAPHKAHCSKAFLRTLPVVSAAGVHHLISRVYPWAMDFGENPRVCTQLLDNYVTHIAPANVSVTFNDK